MSKFAFGVKTFIMLCALLFSCSRTKSAEAVKFQQYYANGELIYGARCSNCHQKSGEGLGLVYPPVNTSDFLDQNTYKVFCLIKYGKKGEMNVNGKSYNQPMPGVPTLTDLEIAELSTYLYNTWGRNRGIIELDTVSRIIEKCPQ